MNILLYFRKRLARFATREEGNSLVETALVLPLLLLLLIGAVDVGRAFRAAMIVNGAASTGAAYGTHYPTDTSGMQLAAKLNPSNLVSITPTATYGCECADGTSAVASCSSEPSCATSMNSVYYVQLVATATYTPILPWPAIPATILLTSKVRLRASR